MAAGGGDGVTGDMECGGGDGEAGLSRQGQGAGGCSTGPDVSVERTALSRPDAAPEARSEW